MRQIRMPALLSVLILVIAFVTFGCAEPAATPAPTEEADHVAEEADHEEEAGHEEGEEAHEEGDHDESEEAGHEEVILSAAALRGQDVFNTVGCMACHGQNAEGTTVAPALAGHTEEQVRRQARAAVGLMPVFSPDVLPDAQLDDLVAYITGLGGGHAHEREGGDVGAEVQMHHWMALLAIEDGGMDEGRHHVQHIIELTEGDHQARMQGVIDQLDGSDTHEAAHTIEEMLVGILDNGVSGETMHLRLALSSVRIEDTDAAYHHLEHFIATAEHTEHEAAEAIAALIQAVDLTAAEHELGELLEAMGAAVAGEPAHEEGHDDGHEEGAEAVSPELVPLSEALEAIQAGDLETATHLLEDYAVSASVTDRLKTEAAIAALSLGNAHDAQDIIGELLGQEEHGH